MSLDETCNKSAVPPSVENATAMLEAINDFRATPRDEQIMANLSAWHERSLKMPDVIGVPQEGQAEAQRRIAEGCRQCSKEFTTALIA
ncbi:MAG: hypothetical protein ABIA92_05790 [Patescibacteria group bacterium]